MSCPGGCSGKIVTDQASKQAREFRLANPQEQGKPPPIDPLEWEPTQEQIQAAKARRQMKNRLLPSGEWIHDPSLEKKK